MFVENFYKQGDYYIGISIGKVMIGEAYVCIMQKYGLAISIRME